MPASSWGGNLRDLKVKEAKPKHSAFKAYEPGYLHIDVKYHSHHSYGVANDCANGSSNIGDGKAFTDRLFGLRKRATTGKQGFDTLCSELGIYHRLTPAQSPQTNGMVERVNGRIEDVLQSHHFRSGEDLNATMHRYLLLYNQHLPQSVLQSRTPLQAMKDRNKLKPELFKKNPYYLKGCDM
jgi:hypothetical protein